MDIVIVGAGKAGALHLRAYQAMMASGVLTPSSRIGFVDIRGLSHHVKAQLRRSAQSCETFSTLVELARSGWSAPQDAICDLCTPSGTFVHLLREARSAGFERCIVEKPFIVFDGQEDIAAELTGLKTVMIQNYLFSKVHLALKDILRRYDLKPVAIVTNFSKNRIEESMAGRAFGERIPTVFEIEMPHQLYIATDLCGPLEALYLSSATDMATPTGLIPRFGQGLIAGRLSSGALCVHYSSLVHDRVVRTTDVIANGDYHVHAMYAPVCEELASVRAGIIVSRGHSIVEQRIFDSDDNMLETLTSAVRRLTSSEDALRCGGIEHLRAFSNVMRAVLAGTSASPSWRDDATPLTVLQQWIMGIVEAGVAQDVAGRCFAHIQDVTIRQAMRAMTAEREWRGVVSL